MATVTPLRQPEEPIIISRAFPIGLEIKKSPVFRYGQALPHELSSLAPLIIEFFKEVKYTKAAEQPWPVINQMYREMSTNPYSIVYVCVDQDMKAHGYCWFKVERNVWNEPYINIEHDYVIAEHRNTMKEAHIHRDFIKYIIEIGERCGVQYVNTSVKTKKLEASRMKIGFKPVELKMTFTGGAKEFRDHNPSFQQYGKYEEENNDAVGEV